MRETYDRRPSKGKGRALPSVLEAGDNGTNEATLRRSQSLELSILFSHKDTNLDAIRLDSNEAI